LLGGSESAASRLRLGVVVRLGFRPVAGLAPYIHFPGTAREALSFYAEVFGGATQLHSFAEFSRTDGPADAVAHGYLLDAPIALYAADVAGDEPAFRAQGLMLSLLGTADATKLRTWFARLADGGTVVDDLQERPWGAFDGQVIDRYGVHWLIGFENHAEV
jgi:PhnB protein